LRNNALEDSTDMIVNPATIPKLMTMLKKKNPKTKPAHSLLAF